MPVMNQHPLYYVESPYALHNQGMWTSVPQVGIHQLSTTTDAADVEYPGAS